MQSPSAVQLPKQALGPQTYGVQAWGFTPGQVSDLVHLAERVAVPALQLAARHWVLDPGKAQTLVFAPSQLPPHELPSDVHAPRNPWGAPLTGEQVPVEPITSHA